MISETEIKKYKVIGMIIVRGAGSTFEDSRKQRSLWDLCGKPVIGWGIESALSSKYINDLVVVTEDKDIKKVSEEFGAKVIDRPLYSSYNRPRDYKHGIFARHKPRSLWAEEPPAYTSAWKYGLWCLEKEFGIVGDLLFTVRADMPLGTVNTVNKVVEEFFQDEMASQVITIYPVDPKFFTINPTTGRVFPIFLDSFQNIDRQSYPPLYKVGPFGICGIPAVEQVEGICAGAVIIDGDEGINIHNEEDLALAKIYMEKRLKKGEVE